jgi:hypothetical protein
LHIPRKDDAKSNARLRLSVDVRFCSNKPGKTWEGYKVHLTETCDADTPNLITSVQTTMSTVSDSSVTEGEKAPAFMPETTAEKQRRRPLAEGVGERSEQFEAERSEGTAFHSARTRL